MRLRILLAALSLIAAGPSSGIDVARRGDRVLIHATSSTLVDVLARFAEATGAEVVYEAARPRQLVTVSIDAHTEAEALAQLLEGQGLNYALRLDAQGLRVQMLVISGTAVAAPARDAVPGRGRTPPPSSFEPALEEPEDEGLLPEQDLGGAPEEAVPSAPAVEPPSFAAPTFTPGNPGAPGVDNAPTGNPNVPPGSPPLVQQPQPQMPFPASYPHNPAPASYPTPGD